MNEIRAFFCDISMNGRIAYSIMCAEAYAITVYPQKNWKPLFKWMWKATCEPFDEWYYRFMEILPEFLFEFDSYEESHFEYLSKDDYDFYSSLLKDIDKNMSALLKIAADISMVYCYMPIPGKGKKSIDLVLKAINIIQTKGIIIPDPHLVSFSEFSEKNGWGEKFDREVDLSLFR